MSDWPHELDQPENALAFFLPYPVPCTPYPVPHTLPWRPTVFLTIDQPLDLASTLLSGQAFRWRIGDSASFPLPDPLRQTGGLTSSPPTGETTEGVSGSNPWYHGVIFHNIVRLRAARGGIEFYSAPDDERVVEPLLRDYLGLNVDIHEVYRNIGTDDRMRASIARYPGMRILRQEPWECLVSFLCAQASNIPRITKNIEDISTTFGRTIEIDGVRRRSFPTPQELAKATRQQFWDLRLGYRADYIYETTQLVAGGQVDLMSLREMEYDATLQAMLGLPGVGDKVANCIMLFSLDRLDAFPVDVWIDRAMHEWYFTPQGKKMNRKHLRLWAMEQWGRYAGYANHYLFHGRRLMGKEEAAQTG